MEISYNNKPIQYEQFFTPNQTTNEPSLKLSNLGYKYYTLIMYDPDAINGTYWHWILSNIDNIDNPKTKNALLSYTGPNPPNAKKHRYIFELYGTNEKTPSVSFDSRTLSLEEGKKILSIKNNPIISTLFLSQREKGGKKIKTKKRIQNKNKRRKFTRKI
jgi:phosphatidylethanolamine-binding protein (PEBP) family uncharacterized protein